MAKTVLIVDDDLSFAEMAAHILEDEGLQNVIVRDAEDALVYLRTQRPDAILLDLGLPGMDGGELLQHLKAEPQMSQIPVVICTISREMGLQEEMLKAGAVDFIDKSAYLAELAPRIKKILGA